MGLSLREGDQCGSVSEGRKISVGLSLREGDQCGSVSEWRGSVWVCL